MRSAIEIEILIARNRLCYKEEREKLSTFIRNLFLCENSLNKVTVSIIEINLQVKHFGEKLRAKSAEKSEKKFVLLAKTFFALVFST